MIRVSALVMLITMVLGCAPRRAVRESSGSCTPQNLLVEAGDKTLTVVWEPNCDKLISGYNIYISGEPGRSSREPFNSTPFSGDTEPDDGIEHFVAERLENGKKYYVSVQTVLPDRTQSQSSREIIAACSPRGEIELSIRYKSETDGFSFAKNKAVRADELTNDIYFYTKDGKDFLVSPRRLDGFLKDNRLAVLKQRSEFETVKRNLIENTIPVKEQRIEITVGDWVLLKTEDDMYALLKVLGLTGSGESRRVQLFYAYSTIEGEMFF